MPIGPRMADEKNSQYIRLRSSPSGVKYGDPVILKDNSQSRVSFVPFFIQHSDHVELASKVVTWHKGKHGPKQNDEKSVSLSGVETLALLRALQSHAQLAGDGSALGDYIVIKVGDGGENTDLSTHDPKDVAAALMRVLGQSDILEHLKHTELSVELSSALRSAIRIKEVTSAVEQLRQMLNSGIVAEIEYQKWCDNHFWAFGAHKQLTKETRSISASDKVDKLLTDIPSGLADVVELKRPDMDVILYDKAHRNYYFSAEVSKAIGQCHRYLDILHDHAANGLLDHPEIVAYHPRATIIIGRSIEWPEDKTRALHGLNQRLRSIKVMTYDHLVAQSEGILSSLSVGGEASSSPSIQNNDIDLDDEIPF